MILKASKDQYPTADFMSSTTTVPLGSRHSSISPLPQSRHISLTLWSLQVYHGLPSWQYPSSQCKQSHGRHPSYSTHSCCPQRYIPSSRNFVWLIISEGLCVARVCILIKLPEVYRLNTVHPLAYVDSYPARSHRMENRNCHHSVGMPGAAYPHRPSFTLSWKREHLCLCLVLPFFLWTDKLIFRTLGSRPASCIDHPSQTISCSFKPTTWRTTTNFILRVRVISTFVTDTYCQLTFRASSILRNQQTLPFMIDILFPSYAPFQIVVPLIPPSR